MKKNSNVFIGPVEVANILNTLSAGLTVVGVKNTFYSYKGTLHEFGYQRGRLIPNSKRKLRIFGKNLVVILNVFVKIFFFFYILFKHDTFIFISPYSFFKNHNDLKILSFFRKKVIFLFVGCQEREVDFMKDEPEYICNRCTDTYKQKICLCYDIQKKKQRVQLFEKYSSYIIAQNDCSGYLRKLQPVWLHLIAKEAPKKDYLAKYHDNKIRIVHFPSNPLIKLSHIIIPVLNEIETEYDYAEVVIKSGIPHHEVLEELEKAHILIDALGLSYGMLAIEAMARGCVVVVGEMNYINAKLPDFACISATSQTLKDKIELLLTDRELLSKTAVNSMAFYEKYHSPTSAGAYYKEKLNL